MIKILQLIWALLFVQNLSGQSMEKNYPTVNPYSNYKYSSFECTFKSNDKTILAYCDKTGKKDCSNFLTSSFGDDSTYEISLTLFERKDSMAFERVYNFEGKFEIDVEGTIFLLGKHPFSSDSIKIKEKKYKNETYTLGYTFKLNDEFNLTNKRKLLTYCDGSCVIILGED